MSRKLLSSCALLSELRRHIIDAMEQENPEIDSFIDDRVSPFISDILPKLLELHQELEMITEDPLIPPRKVLRK